MIVDEVHRSLSDNYKSLYDNIKYNNVLGLTATKPQAEGALELLGEVCPIVYERGLSDMVEGGILPEFKIMNLEVPLTGKEAAKYKIFDSQFSQGLIELSKARAKSSFLAYKYSNAFDMAKELRLLPKDSPLKKSASKF